MEKGKDPIYKYEPLWGNWHVEELIGKGSFGSVYKVSRKDLDYKYVSAVKIISVPNEEQYREAVASSSDTDERTLLRYFEDIVGNIIKEINLLFELKGESNIISYEDHMLIEKTDEIGWDILIRMEYATSLVSLLSERQLTRADIIRLGTDICSALALCEKKGIIHRDIKDENIFISEKGSFKVGDFGIARELSKSGRAASRMGTPLYMAPEVARGEKYTSTIDMYSLGIVMYKLLNNGRMPFIPPYPQEFRHKDSEAALERRMSGEQLPLPALAGEKLGAVILKACAFKPSDRYRSAAEMKRELEKVLNSMDAKEKNEPVTLLKAKSGAKKEGGSLVPPPPMSNGGAKKEPPAPQETLPRMDEGERRPEAPPKERKPIEPPIKNPEEDLDRTVSAKNQTARGDEYPARGKKPEKTVAVPKEEAPSDPMDKTQFGQRGGRADTPKTVRAPIPEAVRDDAADRRFKEKVKTAIVSTCIIFASIILIGIIIGLALTWKNGAHKTPQPTTTAVTAIEATPLPSATEPSVSPVPSPDPTEASETSSPVPTAKKAVKKTPAPTKPTPFTPVSAPVVSSIGWESSGFNYGVNDIVACQGSYYLCLRAHNASKDINPTNSSGFWRRIPVWSPGTVYSGGDIAIYNDRLYLCTTSNKKDAGIPPVNAPAYWTGYRF